MLKRHDLRIMSWHDIINKSIKHGGYSVMTRTGIDYDDVKQTAIKLLSQGIPPSVQKIREHMGTGSNTTIAQHLKRWREEHAKKAIHHLPATIPKELISTFEVLWQTAMEHANDQWTGKREAIDQAQVLSQQRLQEAEKEILQLKQQVETYTTQLTQAAHTSHESSITAAVLNERLEKQMMATTALTMQYEERLKRAYAEKDEQTVQNQKLQDEIKILQQQGHTQAQQTQTLLAEQAALHEQSESRWLKLIDKTQQETRDNQKRMEKLFDTKDGQIKFLSSKVLELQQELFERNILAKSEASEKKESKPETARDTAVLTKQKESSRNRRA